MSELVFYHLTDLHTMSTLTSKNDNAIREAARQSRVHDAVINYIIADNSVDIVVISGDNADHGYYREHKEFGERVEKLINAGKQVYCITATHDFGLTAVDKNGESEKKDGVALRSELAEMYKNFGINRAVSKFDDYSYIVKPCEGFRIFCLNDDGDGVKYHGYSDEQKAWIVAEAKKCTESGEFPVVINHHPVLTPSPAYEFAAPGDILGSGDNMAEFFADIGIKFSFTGHTHMHSIRGITSKNGNKFFDINTGCLREYPLKFRKVTIKDGAADIETIPVPDVSFDTKGKTTNQFYSDLFDQRLLGAIDGLENDFDHFVEQAGAISLKRESLEKLKLPLTLTGKVINNITIGGVGRILLCSGCIDNSIKDEKLKYLLASILSNVYGGDEPYGPGTPEYKAIMGVLKRLKPVIKKIFRSMTFEEFLLFIENIIYDPTPDANAHIE